MTKGEERGFGAFAESGAHVPVRDGVFQVVGEENQRDGQVGIADLDGNKGA